MNGKPEPKWRKQIQRSTLTSGIAGVSLFPMLLTAGYGRQSVNTHHPSVVIASHVKTKQMNFTGAPEVFPSHTSDYPEPSGQRAGKLSSNWNAYRATWYSYAGGVGSGTTTATGTHVQEAWTLAVDPKVIPLGSLVEVKFPNGRTHVYQALDTGGAIRGQHIDIFEESLHACIENGIQHVEVKLLGTGPRVGR